MQAIAIIFPLLVTGLFVCRGQRVGENYRALSNDGVLAVTMIVSTDEMSEANHSRWIEWLRGIVPGSRLIYAVFRDHPKELFHLERPIHSGSYLEWLTAYRSGAREFIGRQIEFVITPSVARTRAFTPGEAVKHFVYRFGPKSVADELFTSSIAFVNVVGNGYMPTAVLFMKVGSLEPFIEIIERLLVADHYRWRVVGRLDACFGASGRYIWRNPFEPDGEKCPEDSKELERSVVCESGPNKEFCRYEAPMQ